MKMRLAAAIAVWAYVVGSLSLLTVGVFTHQTTVTTAGICAFFGPLMLIIVGAILWTFGMATVEWVRGDW